MKKTILLFILFGIINRSFGQSVKMGIMAGVNESSFYTPANNSTSSSLITGFHVGLFTEFAMGNLALQPQLKFITTGGSSNYGDVHNAGGNGTLKTTLQYLQLPVNIIYHIPGSKFFFGGGPYIGYGLSGKVKDDYVDYSFSGPPTSGSLTTKYDFGGNNPDYGLNALAGIHLDKILLSLNYQYGFRYIFNSTGVRNTALSASIGYAFL